MHQIADAQRPARRARRSGTRRARRAGRGTRASWPRWPTPCPNSRPRCRGHRRRPRRGHRRSRRRGSRPAPAVVPTRAALTAEELAAYDRARQHFDGVAIARLEGHRCHGCHLDLSPAEMDEVKATPADAAARVPAVRPLPGALTRCCSGSSAPRWCRSGTCSPIRGSTTACCSSARCCPTSSTCPAVRHGGRTASPSRSERWRW